MTFSSRFLSLFLMAILLPAMAADAAFHVYAPTHATRKLHIFKADMVDGQLTLTAEKEVDLGFQCFSIAAHPEKPILYVAGDGAEKGQPPAGAVVYLNADGSYERHVPVVFDHPYAYVSLDRKNRFLLGVDYGGGQVDVYPLGADGVPGQRVAALDEGVSTAHCVWTSPDNRFVYIPYVNDSNTIFQYAFDAETGGLKPLEPKNAHPPDKSGPRHIAYHPKLPIIYFSNEKHLGVSAYDMQKDGQLKLRQMCDAVGADQSKDGVSSSDILITPDGRFIFAGIRGHSQDLNRISRYRVEPNGELTLLGLTPADKIPWGLTLSPDGQYLLVSAWEGETLTAYAITQDGDLAKTASVALPKLVMDLVTK